MSLLTRMLRQDAVLWAIDPDAPVDDFGDPRVLAPVAIKVRWTDKQVEYVASDKTKATSNSVVYTGIDVKPGSVLRLGTVGELVADTRALDQPGAFPVKGFDKTPNIRATKWVRKCYL